MSVLSRAVSTILASKVSRRTTLVGPISRSVPVVRRFFKSIEEIKEDIMLLTRLATKQDAAGCIHDKIKTVKRILALCERGFGRYHLYTNTTVAALLRDYDRVNDHVNAAKMQARLLRSDWWAEPTRNAQYAFA